MRLLLASLWPKLNRVSTCNCKGMGLVYCKWLYAQLKIGKFYYYRRRAYILENNLQSLLYRSFCQCSFFSDICNEILPLEIKAVFLYWSSVIFLRIYHKTQEYLAKYKMLIIALNERKWERERQSSESMNKWEEHRLGHA